MPSRPIPVILDTDIGDDIDDTWALAMLLKSPELDPKLIVSATGDTEFRARLAARMLEVGARTDIAVGIGKPTASRCGPSRQASWVADYPLRRYRGRVHADGVQAIVDAIMRSDAPVTVISIGPTTNIGAALEREPAIAQKAHFVGMHGSFHRHHVTNMNNRVIRDGAIAEWNVLCDIPACQRVFAAPWKRMTITPLDTCGLVMLEGDRYAQLRDSSDPVMRAVMENYRLWSPRNADNDSESHSSVLFDTVAVYLAFTTENLRMREMRTSVSADGFTVEDPAGRPVQVALDWVMLERFHGFLTDRLLG